MYITGTGFTSRETWLTLQSFPFLLDLTDFFSFTFVLFQVIREPGQPNEHIRELATNPSMYIYEFTGGKKGRTLRICIEYYT